MQGSLSSNSEDGDLATALENIRIRISSVLLVVQCVPTMFLTSLCSGHRFKFGVCIIRTHDVDEGTQSSPCETNSEMRQLQRQCSSKWNILTQILVDEQMECNSGKVTIVDLEETLTHLQTWLNLSPTSIAVDYIKGI